MVLSLFLFSMLTRHHFSLSIKSLKLVMVRNKTFMKKVGIVPIVYRILSDIHKDQLTHILIFLWINVLNKKGILRPYLCVTLKDYRAVIAKNIKCQIYDKCKCKLNLNEMRYCGVLVTQISNLSLMSFISILFKFKRKSIDLLILNQ